MATGGPWGRIHLVASSFRQYRIVIDSVGGKEEDYRPSTNFVFVESIGFNQQE